MTLAQLQRALLSHLCSVAVPENHLVMVNDPLHSSGTCYKLQEEMLIRSKDPAGHSHVHPSLRRGCSSGLRNQHQVTLASSTLGCQRQQGDLSQPEPRIISALQLTCSSPSLSASPTGPRKTWAPRCPPGCG